jgi:hypothetical protein
MKKKLVSNERARKKFGGKVQCHSRVLDYPFPAKEKKMRGGNAMYLLVVYKCYIYRF